MRRRTCANSCSFRDGLLIAKEKADPSAFVTRQKRRDDFADREKLILLVTFRGRSLLAPDNPMARGKVARDDNKQNSGWRR
jgi:hypothetical protein